jgi:hypothetical protein
LEKRSGGRSLKISLLEQYFFTSRKNKAEKFVYLWKEKETTEPLRMCVETNNLARACLYAVRNN